MPRKRRVCFVTGTRSEFGLMRSVLRAIARHQSLKLQIVVTGMHLDARHGRTIEQLCSEGWRIDEVVPWGKDARDLAIHTGNAIAGLARSFRKLRTDMVLVAGDRVEAFAAAAATHLSHIPLAHVHGGDRAEGQVDDSLRHAITKLAHIHFPATRAAARRIFRLGEDRWRIHRVGSPGLDGIRCEAVAGGLRRGTYTLLLLHPADPDDALEYTRARMVLNSAMAASIPKLVIIYPNNDPGSLGIIRCWKEHSSDDRIVIHRNLPRPEFLGLVRDAALLLGNSSSGIIEAASFGTPVLDIGNRQRGRQHGRNVTNVPCHATRVREAIRKIWRNGHPRRFACSNVYAAPYTGQTIARIIGRTIINRRLLQKLIAF